VYGNAHQPLWGEDTLLARAPKDPRVPAPWDTDDDAWHAEMRLTGSTPPLAPQRARGKRATGVYGNAHQPLWGEDTLPARVPKDPRVPAIAGYDRMGLSADLQDAILHHYEKELVRAARERRAKELLGLSHRDPTPTAAQCKPHKSELDALTLADAVGYDLWTVAPKISKRYADVTTSGDKPSLVEIALGDSQRGAGLAPADTARGVRATANCFLSWHMAAPLLELVAAQRAQEEKDDTPIFVWNNLFMIRQVSAAPNDFGAIFGTTVPECGFTLAFLDPWDAPSMLTRIWCLAEIYHTVRHRCRLDVAMSAAGRVAFERALIKDFDSITAALSKIDVRKAEAARPGERDKIMAMVEADVGCQRLNELVLEKMRGWVADAGRGALAVLPAAERATSTLIDRVAKLLQDQGKLNEARLLFEERMVGCQAAFGDADPKTLTSINDLADLLQAQGRLDEAQPHFEEALARRRANSHDRLSQIPWLTSMCDLGTLLRSTGRVEKAIELLQRALKGRRAALGDDHPDTLTTMGKLGMALKAVGRWEEAQPLLEEALEGRAVRFGAAHPKTLSAINNLGMLRMAQGRLDVVRPLYVEALAGRRAQLGDNHPKTVTSITNLGKLLHEEGKLVEAHKLLKEAEERGRDNPDLGVEHPRTLTAINTHGLLMLAQGQLGEARKRFEEVCGVRKLVFGDTHPDTLNSIGNLGVLMLAEGKLDEALPLMERALAGIRNVRGNEHSHTRKFEKAIAELLLQKAARTSNV
jgi:tetratricopeptide (TPR) repeat protein